MICPKCGFEQPDSVECMRCGVVVSRYRGPVAGGGTAVPPPINPGGGAVPPALPLSSSEPYAAPPQPPRLPPAPPPLPPGAGTLYQGPAPGTVYQGPPATSIYGPSAGPGYRGTFDTGQVLGQTFRVYFANFIPFVLLTTLALSPVLLFSAYASTLDPLTPLAQVASVVVQLLNLVCSPIATGAITYGVFQQMRGGVVSLADCLRVGLASLLPVLVVAIVSGIGIGCAAMLCLVPGIILAVRWAVAVPAAVEERPGLSGALERSTYLTEGFRWQVFGILFVIGAINIGLVVVLAVGLGISAGSAEGIDRSGGYLLGTSLLSILTTGLAATASSVMYYRLRSVKESIDVDQIASVFD